MDKELVAAAGEKIKQMVAQLAASKPPGNVCFTRFSKQWGELEVAGLDVEYDYPGFLVTKPEVEVAYIKPLPTNEYLEGNALSKDFSYDLPVEVA